jgi:ATP phosphoribosyltransferase regulatory subunit
MGRFVLIRQRKNMQLNDSWLLPEGIEELLSEDAKLIESLRQNTLNLFASWGYDLVIPPMIDFIDSLLKGSGSDLDLQTFKLTDQISGKTLGFRADMTPQVARMDAHHFQHDMPTRYCYAGTVLHTRGDALEKTRSPMQIGAELYGHAGYQSDVEVIRLMLEMLAMAGIRNVHIDLGNVGLFRALSEQAQLDYQTEKSLFEILQRKAKPELEEALAKLNIHQTAKNMFLCLPDLNGDSDILIKARQLLIDGTHEVQQAIDDLETIANDLMKRYPQLPISFDLAELRGYHYHTGVVFAAFVPEVGREIARGGRYDNIGAFFGRARPATGFSADIKVLAQLHKHTVDSTDKSRIFAPYLEGNVGLNEKIRDLRVQGYRVIQELPGQAGTPADLACTAVLVEDGQQWVIKALA